MKNTKTIQSPIGKITLEVDDGYLVAVDTDTKAIQIKHKTIDPIDEKIFEIAERQLREYFSRRRMKFQIFTKIKATDFQMKVWRQIEKIPFGKTATYIEIAKRAGYPGAARAVGNACKRNPLQILVPCHRVTSAAGKLGVEAMKIESKKRLLVFEAAKK